MRYKQRFTNKALQAARYKQRVKKKTLLTMRYA